MQVTKESIVELLKTSDKAVGRALAALYRRQTQEEQLTATAKERNGVGFSGVDVVIGTSHAQFFLARGFLTPKQIACWRKERANGQMRIAKYAGQLLRIAQERQEKSSNVEHA